MRTRAKRSRNERRRRSRILADLKRAEASALPVARRHGVSLASVNKFKKAAGLTKSKKANVMKKVARRRGLSSRPRRHRRAPGIYIAFRRYLTEVR